MVSFIVEHGDWGRGICQHSLWSTCKPNLCSSQGSCKQCLWCLLRNQMSATDKPVVTICLAARNADSRKFTNFQSLIQTSWEYSMFVSKYQENSKNHLVIWLTSFQEVEHTLLVRKNNVACHVYSCFETGFPTKPNTKSFTVLWIMVVQMFWLKPTV